MEVVDLVSSFLEISEKSKAAFFQTTSYGVQDSVFVCFLFMSLIIPLERGRTRALSSEYKLNKRIVQIGWPSYQLTSREKSALVQKPSVRIPKIFGLHGIAEKTKNYLGISALI